MAPPRVFHTASFGQLNNNGGQLPFLHSGVSIPKPLHLVGANRRLIYVQNRRLIYVNGFRAYAANRCRD